MSDGGSGSGSVSSIYVPIDVVLHAPDNVPKKKKGKGKDMIWVIGHGYVAEKDL